MNVLVAVLLGWMAVSRVASTEDGEEPGKTIVTEYLNGNLEERLTVDHSSYHTPTTGPDGDQPLGSKLNSEQPRSRAAFAGLPLGRSKQLSKKLIIPVYEPPEERKNDLDRVTQYGGGYNGGAPTPTLPQDFLNEINEMKIPKDDLPISIQDYKLYAQNTLPQTLEDNMGNDIEEPDFRKYFHKDYHVPAEYNRFKFNFKGYHQDKVDGDDDGDDGEDGRDEPPDDDDSTEHNDRGRLTAFKENEELITVTPPFRVVTETRIKYEDHKQKPIKFPYDFEGNTVMHGQNNLDKQCFVNCQSDGLKSAPYGIHHYNYRHLQHPPFAPPPPRLIRTTLPFYHRHSDPVIATAHYHYHRRVPVSRPVLYSYPIRRPYPYVRYYSRLPYPYRSYGRPKYYPSGKPVISPGNPNIRHPTTDAERTRPDRDCPPSKIVKEVHVHHYPKGEVDDSKTPPPIELDEANHQENFDHEPINEGEDESSGDEDELADGEHEELIELSQHLDNALFRNKQQLVRHLNDGQRYHIYDEDDSNKYDDYAYEQEERPRDFKKILKTKRIQSSISR